MYASAVLLLIASLAACGSSPRARHVVIITLDTMRADRLPAYGFRGIVTPALDALASEGVIFEQAFAPVPLTLPSHASLFSGLNPYRLGVRDNAGAPLSDDVETLAEIMAARGARTGAFVASSVLGPARGLAQGFHTYSTGADRSCADAPNLRRPADAVVDDALRWLATDASTPFFAWIHLYDAHRPYRLPESYRLAYADPYSAALAFEDEQIGRVIAHLRSAGLFDDTLLVVVGDHGESLGDHGEDSHGIFVYQETLRVPLIVRGPGIAPARVTGIVRLIDVMPTIIDLLGAPARSVDGASMTALLRGRNDGVAREVYAESLYPERFGWASLRSLRADRYKVIQAPRPELYDLDTDPTETRNVFESKPAVAATMLARLRVIGGDSQPLPSARIDAAQAERLAALGYASNPVRATGSGGSAGADPKDTIATFNAFTKAQWERGRAAAPCAAGATGTR